MSAEAIISTLKNQHIFYQTYVSNDKIDENNNDSGYQNMYSGENKNYLCIN